MAEEHVRRRLAAILAADVAGYSRLMGEDEEATLAALTAHRTALIEPAIAAHRGRVVKTTGDGILAEFASVVEAVRCAVAIQHGLAARNAGISRSRRIEFRIGVNLGDVMVQDDDVYGDGVNVAARLEGLAEPGGICVSGDVYRQARGKVDIGFEDLGEREVKNIAEPVRVYRVLLEPEAAGREVVAARTRLKRWKWPASAAAGIVAALLLAGAFGVFPIRAPGPPVEPAPVERMALPLPDKPSIAVLPFDNLSGDPGQEYFADGMTEDLITDLSKISGLFVIARNSSFRYKGETPDLRAVGRELGVRYVLEGSVRRGGDRVRINAQLVDAGTGGHLWAERYDGALSDIFALQDAVTAKVVQALELRLSETEKNRRREVPRTASPEAYDLVLQARNLLTRFDRRDADKARKLLERAIELDPDYAESYSLLGLYYFDAWRLWGDDQDGNLSRALALGKTGAELDPADPAPHVLLAQVHQFRREFDAASAEADAALALEPNDAIALANLGSMLRYAHRAAEAVEVVERAIRLDPYHPPNYLEWLSDSYFFVGRYDDCVQAANRGVALDPDFVALRVTQAQCHAALGEVEKARKAAAEILRTNPRFTLKVFASYAPFSDDRDSRFNVEMLRKAGVPE